MGIALVFVSGHVKVGIVTVFFCFVLGMRSKLREPPDSSDVFCLVEELFFGDSFKFELSVIERLLPHGPVLLPFQYDHPIVSQRFRADYCNQTPLVSTALGTDYGRFQL